ncbi:MAG: hypothetical protein WD894_20330 [Pirellulales bacterium]
MNVRLFTAALVLAGTLSAPALAEVPGEYFYGYRPASSTALGDALHGGSQVIRSTGEAVRNGSVAAVNLERAKSQYLRNNYEATKIFWEKRLLYKEKSAQLRGQPLTSDQIRKIARDAAPDRLNTLQLSPTTGAINWPEALMRPEFDKLRPEVEKIFVNRTVANSGSGSSSETAIARLTKAMHQDLKAQINVMSTNEYMVARSFLRSLAYEARFVPGLEGVAQR